MKKYVSLLVVCLAWSAPARAQINLLPVRYTFASGTTQSIVLPATDARLTRVLLGAPSPTRELSRPKALVPLYMSMGALQALDAVSTHKAIAAGGQEANPLMAPVVGSTAGLIALKSAVTGSMIVTSERLWKTNRKAAILILVGTNLGYAAIVSHNFAISRR